MISVRRLAVPVGVALSVLGAACGGGGGDATAPGGESSPAQGEANAGGTSTLVARDNEFVPSDFTVQAGSDITLQNEGQAPHNLTVEGQNVDQDVQAGQSTTVSLDLEPGTYDMVCKFHESAGMTGTLTVEG